MLLLYLKEPTQTRTGTIFTFHYASTLSNSGIVNTSLPSAFTFHYASTLSSFSENADPVTLNLHSTMLLLYRRGARLIIYIPLCFYFIRADRAACDDYHKFTFHYASTLSRSSFMHISQRHNLHSTMLLLYPERSTAGTWRGSDLHSTMLLLYH